MKKLLSFNFVLFTLLSIANAQTPSINFDDFKGPTTPAFSILGFEPTSVLRPTSPSQLSSTILSSFDENGKIIPNLGIEFIPYWLQSQPTLSWEEYNDPSTWQAIVQTFAISGATVKDSASAASTVGLGFRFQPVNGNPSNAFINKADEFFASLAIEQVVSVARVRGTTITELNDLKNLFKRLIDGQSQLDESVRITAKRKIDEFDTSEEDMSVVLDMIENKYSSETLAKELSELSAQKIGWVAEISGAVSFNSNQIANEQGTVGKFGLWGSLAYKTEKHTDFVFLGRYMFSRGDSSSSNLDLGLSYVKTHDSFQISLESVYRHLELEFEDLNLNNELITRLEKKDTYRIALNAQMALSDVFSVNLSFGKDYDKPLVKEVQFFSILGLNYNLFSKPTLNATNP